jgi:predicted membrane-bound spermidine synthase
MIGAIFVHSQADTALRLAALICLSYAGSRFISMVIDGVPDVGLVQAAVIEGIIGLACAVVNIIRRMPVRAHRDRAQAIIGQQMA